MSFFLFITFSATFDVRSFDDSSNDLVTNLMTNQKLMENEKDHMFCSTMLRRSMYRMRYSFG